MKDEERIYVFTCLLVYVFSFHIDRFKRELFASDDFCTDTMTLRADEFSVGGMVFVEAGHALQFGRDAAKMERGFFCDGVFCDDLPVELDGVIHHAGELAHDDVQVGDAFGIRFFGVVECDFQNRFSDGEFVHLVFRFFTCKV